MQRKRRLTLLMLLLSGGCLWAQQPVESDSTATDTTVQVTQQAFTPMFTLSQDEIPAREYYGNDWNRPNVYTCVHAFIGYDKNDKVKCYRTLPFDICCWGVGSGYKGSYNYDPAYIQFEMCEDSLEDKDYCEKVCKKAVELCVYLCKKYGIDVKNIVSHREAHEQGFGSDHIDPANWWDRFGLTMDKFRRAVKKGLEKKVKTNKKLEI